MRDLVIIPELEKYLDEVDPVTDEMLEKVLQRDGCQDAIKVWKERNAIVDGHRRYKLCRKHGIPFEVVEISFASVEEAKLYMLDFQHSRRQTDATARALQLAEVLELERKAAPHGAVKRAAAAAGVSTRTMIRADKFADEVKQLPEKVRAKIERGGIEASQPAVSAFIKLPPEEQAAVAERIDSHASLAEAINPDKPKRQRKPKEPAPVEVKSDSVSPSAAMPKPLPEMLLEATERLGKFARTLDLMEEADTRRYADCRIYVKKIAAALEAWGTGDDAPF